MHIALRNRDQAESTQCRPTHWRVHPTPPFPPSSKVQLWEASLLYKMICIKHWLASHTKAGWRGGGDKRRFQLLSDWTKLGQLWVIYWVRSIAGRWPSGSPWAPPLNRMTQLATSGKPAKGHLAQSILPGIFPQFSKQHQACQIFFIRKNLVHSGNFFAVWAIIQIIHLITMFYWCDTFKSHCDWLSKGERASVQ